VELIGREAFEWVEFGCRGADFAGDRFRQPWGDEALEADGRRAALFHLFDQPLERSWARLGLNPVLVGGGGR
jgi:hypothetical protein